MGIINQFDLNIYYEQWSKLNGNDNRFKVWSAIRDTME